MGCFARTIQVDCRGFTDVRDITGEVEEAIR